MSGEEGSDPALRTVSIGNKLVTKKDIEAIEKASEDAVEESVKFALSSPEPTLESAFEDIFAP